MYNKNINPSENNRYNNNDDKIVISYLTHLPHQLDDWRIIEKLLMTLTMGISIQVFLQTRFSITIFYHTTFEIVPSILKSIPCFIRVLLFPLVIGYLKEVSETIYLTINFVIITDNFQAY